MDLWIRSQDRDRIIKVNNIEVVVDIKWEIYGYTSDEQYYLGQYETRERAIEVLDEIQKIISWLQKDMKDVTIGDLKRLIGSFNDYVYEMPKE